jgi:osmotically-inducible protein OsmY
MVFGNQVPDKTLLKEINRKLMRTGTQSKISACVRGGYVTLTGNLQYEHQRRSLIRAANQVSGVRQVVDQMTVRPRKRVDME